MLLEGLVYFTTRLPDTSETSATRTTRVRMANKKLQGEEQFHSKKYLLEILCSNAKMHLKIAP